MTQVKAELAPSYRALDIGDTLLGQNIVSTFPDSPHVILDLQPGQDVAAVMAVLVRQGLVVDWRLAHTYGVLWLPNTIRPFANQVPGDTFDMMGCTDAVRARGNFGAGVAVLHLDTGVDRDHVAFSGKSLARADPDAHGHGSHTASTVASAWGIASDATLYCANVLPGGSGSEAQIATGMREATDWAVNQRVPAVLTMSLGGAASQVMDAGCEYAKARGVVVVAACGNSGNQTPAPGSPSRAADLQVLACTRERTYPSFTEGPSWTTPNRVTATGVDIAAAARGTTDGVLTISGTSMACPMIAGAVALLLAQGFTRSEVLNV